MFGKSKPVVFKPYGRRRASWRPPRWLVLLLLGIAAGAGGVIVAQERYLPPRLSAESSAQLKLAFEQAESERLRLAGDLATANKQLGTALAETKRLADELATTRTSAEHLRDDLSAAVAALPPDPRGGTVEVRAGRFTARSGMLEYEVVLTRSGGTDKSAAKPLLGTMQLVLEGEGERGSPTRLNLKPAALTMENLQVLRGSQPLPDDFKPRQVTIQVLDHNAGKLLGMRVLLVSGPM
jgi:hypothetical protein